jgi:hypothetical protein
MLSATSGGQGDGSTLGVWELAGSRVGALACWEHAMNLVRQAPIEQGEQIHAALWPGISTLAGFRQVANEQIEAMMRKHALTGQCFIVCAASPVSAEMLEFLRRELGPTEMLGTGGGTARRTVEYAGEQHRPMTPPCPRPAARRRGH